ncbi:hypothetical protein FIU87_07590 [Bacillus sp. THAF10]|nr:hypothetical protein [Bacillus sp. THAF10]QFT88501.1 hypothetical protein FIU87_07590 [Bacillus sp. THAF10]
MQKEFELANLSEDNLTKITLFEKQLQEELGEHIVLIAYEECEK